MGNFQGLVHERGTYLYHVLWTSLRSIVEVPCMMMFPNTNPYSGRMERVKNFRNWMIDTATVLFDDSKNDLRALPRTVRLQLLLTLSFIWSTAFTVYIWGVMRTDIWLGWFGGHLAIIFAVYYTFKQFHRKLHTLEPSKEEPLMYDDVWGA